MKQTTNQTTDQTTKDDTEAVGAKFPRCHRHVGNATLRASPESMILAGAGESEP